jgi:hypothetical protein
MKGKSDQVTLTSAKSKNAVRKALRTRNSPHLKEREINIATANTIKVEKMVRSTPFPSSKACSTFSAWVPIHCEGNRETVKNIQITVTHIAIEDPACLAGSNRSRATRRIAHKSSAIDGGILFIRSQPDSRCGPNVTRVERWAEESRAPSYGYQTVLPQSPCRTH